VNAHPVVKYFTHESQYPQISILKTTILSDAHNPKNTDKFTHFDLLEFCIRGDKNSMKAYIYKEGKSVWRDGLTPPYTGVNAKGVADFDLPNTSIKATDTAKTNICDNTITPV